MEVTVRSDGVTVVNDAYNANPDSMRAALEADRMAHLQVTDESFKKEIEVVKEERRLRTDDKARSLVIEQAISAYEAARELAPGSLPPILRLSLIHI